MVRDANTEGEDEESGTAVHGVRCMLSKVQVKIARYSQDIRQVMCQVVCTPCMACGYWSCRLGRVAWKKCRILLTCTIRACHHFDFLKYN